MENKVLHKNLEVISRYDKELSNKILMLDIQKSNLNLVETEKKEYNILFSGIPLHSQNGAIDEAKRIVANIEEKKDKNSVRLLYGLGLGYLLDEMSNEINDSLIIVYEPNLELLKFVFSIAQIDAIDKKNVIICSDKRMLKQHIINSRLVDSKLTISFLTSYKNLFLEDIKDVLNVAQSALGENAGNSKTFKQKALMACRNSILSMGSIMTSPNIFDFQDIYKDKTALCLSAGPSLKENIEIIKKNQDKFVIFAVNQAVKLLVQQNIKPDFIVDIEPNDTSSHLSTIDISEQNIILEGFASSHVWYSKFGKKISYLSNNNFFNPFLRDCLKMDGYLETIGTVSYTALMSAFIMGFKKIILCGQDLAYKNGECYAKGSQYEEVECVYNKQENKYEIKPKNEEEYIKAFETVRRKGQYAKNAALNYLKFLNNNICTVKSQNGENVPTQAGYALFIQQFSDAAAKLKAERPKIELINSSTGGAQIDGFENKKLSEIVIELEKIEKLDLSNYKTNLDKNYVIKKIDELIEFMKIFHISIQELSQVNEKIINEIKNKKVLTKDLEKYFAKFQKIVATILELSEKKNKGFVVSAFMCRFIDRLYINESKEPVELVRNFESLRGYLHTNNELLAKDIINLSNCKTFILK